MRRLLRCLAGAAILLMVVAASNVTAQTWADFATVSMTNPTTPKLTANRLCYTDGVDIACDGAAGLLITSGTFSITNISVTNLTVGGVAVTGGSSGDRITSGTTSMVANSATSIISITNAGVTAGYFNSNGVLTLPGISATSNLTSVTSLYASSKVGIGAAASGYPLEVTVISATSAGIRVIQPNSGQDAVFSLSPTTVGAHEWRLTAADPSRGVYGASFVIQDRTSNTAPVLIDPNGNVGIGRTSPIAKLDVAGTISATSGIQVGTLSATCASGISGTIRFNTTSNTMEFCNGSSWLGLGPSTTVPAFSVYRTTNQTVLNGSLNGLDWTNKSFDTYNNFDLTTDKFTPTIAGKYYTTLAVDCLDNTSYCMAVIYKNAAAVASSFVRGSNTQAVATVLVDMNGSSDYLTAVVLNSGGTTVYADSTGFYTHFDGALVASGNGLSGGGGGSTNPAGSDTQLQYNSGGNFGASSNLAWDNTNRNLQVSGSMQFGGTGSEACSSSADYGKNRRNPTSGRMQVCLFR